MNEPRNKIRQSRKIFLTLILAGAGALTGGSVGFGAVAFDADFSAYTIGTLNGQNSWAQIGTTSTASPIQVVAAAGGVPQSIRVTGVASAAQSFRDLPSASRFDPTTGTEAKTFYYVLENFKVIAALNSTSSTGQGFFALTGTAGGSGSTAARLHLRRYGGVTANTTTFDLGISATGAAAVYGTTALSVGTLYKIVVAYTANPGTTKDVVKVYVNPVGFDPTSWSHEVTQTATSDPTVSFKSVHITPGAVSNSTKIDLTIGRIIVGDSPSDVLPPPAAPAVSEAVGISTSGFVANWSAASGATKYYLDVATDIGFATYVSGFENLDVLTAVSKSVTGTFTAGQSIYYRVRALNSNGTSVNSATQEVVITSAPVVLVPNVTNSATSGTVTWTSGPDWIPNNPVSASNATITFNGVLNGVLTANNDTASPFVLNSLVFANSGVGTNDITGGVLQLTNSGVTNPAITFADNTTYQRVSAPIQLDTNVTVSQSGSTASNSILAGVVSGAGGLTKSGGGYVYLTQTNNSFGGPVAIGNGTLVPENIGMAGQNSSLGTNGTITLGGGSLTGTLRWGSGSVTKEDTDKSFALAGATGGGTIEVRGTTSLLTLNGAIDTGTNASTRFLTLTGQGGTTVNGLISGNAGLRLNGSSSRTVTLANGNNSFGGPVIIDGNQSGVIYKVQVASIGNAGLNSPLGTNKTINIGTTVGSFNFLVWSNTVSETTDKTINLAGTVGAALIANKGPTLLKFTAPVTATGVGTKTFYPDQDDTNGVTEFAGEIPNSSGGTTALNKNGPGTLILSAANTFTGGFILKGGTLELRNAQSLAAGNALTVPTNATVLPRLKVAYAGTGSDLGNLTLGADATIDLGTDNTAEIRFGSATGWAAGKILTVTNSTGGGKLYILETNNVALSQIKSAENPTYPASLALNGLLTFTNPAPVNTAPVITSSQAFAVNENVSLATVVGTVVSTDPDANPTFSGWTIVSGNTGSVFAINAATGQITVAGDLNYEGTPSYSLGVTVSDGTATSAVGTVVVTVTNVAEYSDPDLFGSSSPTADDNGDGISNLMAYALGAASPSSVVVPPALNTTDSTKLTITALIRINDPKVSVVGEYGLTLGTWETASPIAGEDSNPQTGAVAGVTKKKDFSVLRSPEDPKKFMHLKATQSQ
jgi:autotransporter-associated beta strand protein